jgi:methylated-DNA-protein-cysteine methyltransferase-like protein
MVERILEIVASIPRGRVSTYGDVAGRAGSPSPRLVGRVLAELSEDSTPWQRVLRADGRPAHHLAAEQLARLRAEGVLANDGRVDLRRYRWRD